MYLSIHTVHKNPSLDTFYLNSDNKNETNKNLTYNETIITNTQLSPNEDIGSQMFKILCLYSISERSKVKMVLPKKMKMSNLNSLFDIQYNYDNVMPKYSYNEYDNFEDIIVPNDRNIYNIKGQRKSRFYFSEVSTDILKIYKPKDFLIKKCKKYLPDPYICIYFGNNNYNKIQNLLQPSYEIKLSYYRSSIEFLKTKFSKTNIKVIVCSDPESRKHVASLLSKIDPNAIISPTINDLDQESSDFITMFNSEAMVMFPNNNCWMACYLSSKKHVIAPYPWCRSDGIFSYYYDNNNQHIYFPEWYIADVYDGSIIREPSSFGPINYKDLTPHPLKFIRSCNV